MSTRKYTGPDNHTAAHMVPRFTRKRTAPATLWAVRAALRKVPHTYTPDQVLGIAAYIWYQRSNSRKWRFSGYSSNEEYFAAKAEYELTGVFPVCPTRIASIKPATITKYAALAAGGVV